MIISTVITIVTFSHGSNLTFKLTSVQIPLQLYVHVPPTFSLIQKHFSLWPAGSAGAGNIVNKHFNKYWSISVAAEAITRHLAASAAPLRKTDDK